MIRPLLVAAVLSIGFSPAPAPRPVRKSPAQSPQGVWVIVSRTYEGQPTNHVVATVEVSGNRWTYFNAARDWSSTFLLTIDDSKSPRWFDVQHEKNPTSTGTGIFEIKGDTLTRCYTQKAGGRPADFDGSKPGRYLEVYRRQKP